MKPSLLKIHAHFLVGWGILTSKFVRLTWVLVCYQSSLVGLCVQDYESACIAVMICATLDNIHTHMHTRTHLLTIRPMISSASWGKNNICPANNTLINSSVLFCYSTITVSFTVWILNCVVADDISVLFWLSPKCHQGQMAAISSCEDMLRFCIGFIRPTIDYAAPV